MTAWLDVNLNTIPTRARRNRTYVYDKCFNNTKLFTECNIQLTKFIQYSVYRHFHLSCHWDYPGSHRNTAIY